MPDGYLTPDRCYSVGASDPIPPHRIPVLGEDKRITIRRRLFNKERGRGGTPRPKCFKSVAVFLVEESYAIDTEIEVRSRTILGLVEISVGYNLGVGSVICIGINIGLVRIKLRFVYGEC